MWPEAEDAVTVLDYSADGVRRSLEESLERLGIDVVDIAYVHDPDDYLDQAIGETAPALERLRDEGLIRAFGFGMNHTRPLARAVRETSLDCVLVAGRYTLLDQSADDELLPLCLERGVGVVAGGVLNSGVLARPGPGATYDYRPASSELVERALALDRVCRRHGVPICDGCTPVPAPASGRRLRARGRALGGRAPAGRRRDRPPAPARPLARARGRGAPPRRRAREDRWCHTMRDIFPVQSYALARVVWPNDRPLPALADPVLSHGVGAHGGQSPGAVR